MWDGGKDAARKQRMGKGWVGFIESGFIPSEIPTGTDILFPFIVIGLQEEDEEVLSYHLSEKRG